MNDIIDKKYIIFDMDGVLLDSMPSWYKCAYKVLNNLQNEYADISIDSKKDVWSHYNSMNRFEQSSFLEQWYKEMDKEYEVVKTKEYVLEFIKYCKENNIHIAIATSTPKSMAIKVLERLGIYQYLDYLEDEEESKEPKYTGKIFDDITNNIFKTSSDNVIVFEDSFNNIKSLIIKGYKIIGVYDELSSNYEDIFKNTASYYMYSFKELLK